MALDHRDPDRMGEAAKDNAHHTVALQRLG
jgi:hypothetical protein